MSLIRRLAEAVDGGVAVASATVVDTSRSVPRRAGAKMLVFRDGSISGTVGGGEMEARVVAESVAALGDGRCRLLSYRLVDPVRGDPGVCGGDVQIFVEPHMPKPTVIVMGYGHVGRAVAQLAHWLEFRVVACDDRAGMGSDNPPDMPDSGVSGSADSGVSGRSDSGVSGRSDSGVSGSADSDLPGGPDSEAFGRDVGDAVPDELVIGTVDDLLAGRTLDADVSVVLVTRNVDVDAAALPSLLATDAGYVGVMGSERRWATTRARLEADGVDPGALDRVHAPIGIEVGAETPEEIALSIMAEVVANRRK